MFFESASKVWRLRLPTNVKRAELQLGSTYCQRSSSAKVENGIGKIWTSIASNLPHESANALAEDPETKGLIFVGTDLGVYVSVDGGQDWASLCHTLPTASIVDLAVHGRAGALNAATQLEHFSVGY